MSFRYPVPNENQAEILRRNKIDPDAYMVSHADKDGDYIILKNYKTGDEISVRPNPLKKGRN